MHAMAARKKNVKTVKPTAIITVCSIINIPSHSNGTYREENFQIASKNQIKLIMMMY